MTRREFSQKTKRAAYKRSSGFCEGDGALYGLTPGRRCNADLSYGVEFDHVDLDANSKDNSLENCKAVCLKCHSWKTRHVDIPRAAKTLRQQDKDRGIRKPSSRPVPGSRNSPWKRLMDGTTVRRNA